MRLPRRHKLIISVIAAAFVLYMVAAYAFWYGGSGSETPEQQPGLQHVSTSP